MSCVLLQLIILNTFRLQNLSLYKWQWTPKKDLARYCWTLSWLVLHFIPLSGQIVGCILGVDSVAQLEPSCRNVSFAWLFSSRIPVQGSAGFGLSRCCIQTSKSWEQKRRPTGLSYRAETYSGKLRPAPPGTRRPPSWPPHRPPSSGCFSATLYYITCACMQCSSTNRRTL